jgi:hypothetical protein
MPQKLPKRAKNSAPSPKRVRRDALDLIAREAGEVAQQQLRELKDSQPKFKGTKTKIPVAELTLDCCSMRDIAQSFEGRLVALGSSAHALNLRLCKWRRSGHRDVVMERGRPRTAKLTPVKKLSIARSITNSQVHLHAAQVNAISSNLLGGATSNKRQQKAQRRDLRKSNGVIRAVSKQTAPALLHAANSQTFRFKLHDDMMSAYAAEPTFLTIPDSVINFDEGNDPDRGGRQGFKTHGFTTVARLVREGRTQLRTLGIPDGAGTASTAPWFAASGVCIAKTPIVKAPEGWDFGPQFLPPPHFTEPARHSGIPFLPGMGKDYFTSGNTRVFCTESGVNTKECFTRMFIDFVYPLCRVRVPLPKPLLLVYDSCGVHNWTPELSQFFASNNVHVMKLYHNTTTATQPLDCGVNLQVRNDTAAIQDNLMAAASFKHGYLGDDMKCKFRD